MLVTRAGQRHSIGFGVELGRRADIFPKKSAANPSCFSLQVKLYLSNLPLFAVESASFAGENLHL
jgi:hypothetical protein